MSGFSGDIYGRKIFLQSVAPPAATSGGSYIYADITDSDKVKVVNSSGGTKDISTINSKYDANINPATTDIVDPSAPNKRFEVGSRWVNKLLNKEWVLTSFTDSTHAIWVETTAAGGGGGGSITIANEGLGVGQIYDSTNSNSSNAYFKTVTATTNKIIIDNNTNTIGIDVNQDNLTNLTGVTTLGSSGAGTITVGNNLNLGTNSITLTNVPSAGTDAANKTYVDMVALGLGPTLACVAKTTDTDVSTHFVETTNFTAALELVGGYNVMTLTQTLSSIADGGLQGKIDGYSSFSVNDRILFASSGSNAYYGIYDIKVIGDGITSWKLQRSNDLDNNPTTGEVKKGIYTFITNGTANINTGWALLTNDPISLDVTPQSWGQITSAAAGSHPTYNSVTGGNIKIGSGQDIKSISGNVDITAGTIATDSVRILNTTTSTNSASGSLIVSGGIGVSGDVFINPTKTLNVSKVKSSGNVDITAGTIGTNSVHILNTTNSTAYNNGSLIVDGGLGIAKDVFIKENIIVKTDAIATGTNNSSIMTGLISGGTNNVSIMTGLISGGSNSVSIMNGANSGGVNNINIGSTNVTTTLGGDLVLSNIISDGTNSVLLTSGSGMVSKLDKPTSTKILQSDATGVVSWVTPVTTSTGTITFSNNTIGGAAGNIIISPTSGNVSVAGNKIVNLATPTATGDAATFEYVNTKNVTFNSLGLGEKVYAGTSGATSTNPSFKSINANSDKITISSNVGNTEVLIDVDPTQFNNIGDLTSNFTVEGLSVSIPNTTSSTNTNTGSLHLGGGLGVAENVNIGGVLNARVTNIKGVTNINNTAADGNTTIGNSGNTVTVKGVTNINNTASSGNTTIGNSSNTVTVKGVTNINNTVSSGNTTIGNNSNTITINGSTNIISSSDNDTNSVNISSVNLNDASILGNVNIKSNVTYDTSTGTAGNVNIFGNNTVADAVNMGSVNIMTGTYSHTGTDVYGVNIATGNFLTATEKPTINIGSSSSGVLSLNGSSINANSKRITSVANPSSIFDAANRSYVDTEITNHILTISSQGNGFSIYEPTNSSATSAKIRTIKASSTKATVDYSNSTDGITIDVDPTKFDSIGDNISIPTFTIRASTNVDVGGKRITSVANPSGVNDAANRSYVDTTINNNKLTVSGEGDGVEIYDTTTSTTTSAKIKTIKTLSTKLSLNDGGSISGISLDVDPTKFDSIGDNISIPTFTIRASTNIDVNNKRISSVAAPAGSADAANRNYVDTSITTAVNNNKLIVSGKGTGVEIYDTTTSTPTSAVIKTIKAVSTKVTIGDDFTEGITVDVDPTKFNSIGDNISIPTFTIRASTNVDVNNKRITSVAAPSGSADAANRSYVDTSITTAVNNNKLAISNEGDGINIYDAINSTATLAKIKTIKSLSTKLPLIDVDDINGITVDVDPTKFDSIGDNISIPTFTIRASTNVDVNNKRITSVAAPSGSADAANRSYVDTTINNNKLTVTGKGTGIEIYDTTTSTPTSAKIKTIKAVSTKVTIGDDTNDGITVDVDPTKFDSIGGITNTTFTINASTNVDVNSKKITSVANPTQDTDAANKSYVDMVALGLGPKNAVLVKTTASDITNNFVNITNFTASLAPSISSSSYTSTKLTATSNIALPTIDGITMNNGDRILFGDSGTFTINTTSNYFGIYKVIALGVTGLGGSPWVLQRDEDADDNPVIGEVRKGIYTFIQSGTIHANTGWALSFYTAPLDSNPQLWAQVTTVPSSSPSYTQAQGGNVIIGPLNAIHTVSSNIDITANDNSISTGTVNIKNTTSSSNNITGAVVVSGGVGIAQNTNIGGTINVTGAATLGSTLNAVNGLSTLHSLTVNNASTLNSLGVTNAATVGTTLGVSGEATLNSLSVTNAATVGTTLGVSGEATLNSLSVTNAATVGTTIGVGGLATLNSLTVTNTATVGTTIGVGGKATLNSLEVTNAATVGTTLGVGGATTLSSTLGVSGKATLNSLEVTNAATVGTTLGVSGEATLNSLTVTNAATVGTTLGVSGATTLSSTLGVGGKATLNSLEVTNAATVGTTLGVSGATTLSSTLDVTTNLSTLHSLTVNNLSTLSGVSTTGTANINTTGTAITTIGTTNSANSVRLMSNNSDITSGSMYLLSATSGNVGIAGTTLMLNSGSGTGIISGGITYINSTAGSGVISGGEIDLMSNASGGISGGTLNIMNTTGAISSSSNITANILNSTGDLTGTNPINVNILNSSGTISGSTNINILSGSVNNGGSFNLITGSTNTGNNLININTGNKSGGSNIVNISTGTITGGTNEVNIGNTGNSIKIGGNLTLNDIKSNATSGNSVVLTSNTGSVSSLDIPTGSTKVLQSDTSGNISWAVPSGGGSTGTITFSGNTIGGASGNITISPTSGSINVASNKIISLANPTENTDAANKTYVDIALNKDSFRFYQNDFSLTLVRQKLTNQVNNRTYISEGLKYSYAKVGNNLVGNAEIVYDFDTTKNKTVYLAGLYTGAAVNSAPSSIAYSEDSTKWNPIGVASSSALMNQVYDIAYNGNVWVAVGGGNHAVMYSYDGISWTGLGVCAFGGNTTQLPTGMKVKWDGKKFIATCKSAATLNTTPATYGGVRYINTTTSPSFIFKSGQMINTTNPTGVYYVTNVNGNNITTSDGVFSSSTIINHNMSHIIYSYDGINWTASLNFSVDTMFEAIFTALCSNGDIVVANSAGSANTTLPHSNPQVAISGQKNFYSNDYIIWEIVGTSGYYHTIWTGKNFISYGGLNIQGNTYERPVFSKDGKNWYKTAYLANLTDRGIALPTSSLAYNGTILTFGNDLNANTYYTDSKIDYFTNNTTYLTIGNGCVSNTLTADIIPVTSPAIRKTCSKWVGNKFLSGFLTYVTDGKGLIQYSTITNSIRDVSTNTTNPNTYLTFANQYDHVETDYADTGIVNSTNVVLGTYTMSFGLNNKKRNTVTFVKDRVILGLTTTNISYALQISDDKGRTNTTVSTNVVNNGNSNSINAIAFNPLNKMWVAASNNGSTGSSNTLLYSNDNGYNWIGLGNNIVSSCHVITSGNNMLVMIGYIGNDLCIWYSFDGVTWCNLGISIFGTSTTSLIYSGVAWNGSKFVACAGDTNSTNTLAYSLDGINWTGLGKSIFSTTGRGVIWDGSKFIAIGTGTNTVAYSYDGINWNGLGTGIVTTPLYIESNGEGVTVITQNSTTLIVGDGFVWSNVTAGDSSRVKWVGDRFITSNNAQPGSTIYYSYNGYLWNSYSSGLGAGLVTGNYVSCVGWNNSSDGIVSIAPTTFALGGDSDANIATSNDGIKYTVKGKILPFDTSANSISYNGSIWVALGQGTTHTIAYSFDNETWIGLGNSIFSTKGNHIIWGNGKFIAVGEGTNTIAYSIDGIVWTGLGNSIFSTRGNKVALGSKYISPYGLLYVAVGTGTNGIAYSSDGITWTGVNTYTSMNSIVYGYGKYNSTIKTNLFVAVGDSNAGSTPMVKSLDGITWITPSNNNNIGFPTAINDIAFGPSKNSTRYNATVTPASTTIIGIASNLAYEFTAGMQIRVILGNNFKNVYTITSITPNTTETNLTVSPAGSSVFDNTTVFIIEEYYKFVIGANISNNSGSLCYSYDSDNWICADLYNTATVSSQTGSTINVTFTNAVGNTQYNTGNYRFKFTNNTPSGIVNTDYAITSNTSTSIDITGSYTPAPTSGSQLTIYKPRIDIFSTACTKISFAGDKFVAVGTGGNNQAYSLDGIVWYAVGTARSANLPLVNTNYVFTNNKFGPIVVPNKLKIDYRDSITIQAPEYYDKSLTSDVSITFQQL
jgi:hypothetical protein